MACINCGSKGTLYVTCGGCQGAMVREFAQRFKGCTRDDIDNMFWFMDATLCQYVPGTNVLACKEQWDREGAS